MDKTLDNFRYFLLKRNLQPETIQGHISKIKTLLRLITPFTKENFERFLLEKSHLAPNSKNDYVTTARLWAEFIGDGSFTDLPFFLRQPVLRATMSDDEIERFLKVRRLKKQPKEVHATYTLFFKILAFTGMRPGEVAALRKEDIDLGKNVFVVRQAKTPAGVRLVPIPPNVLPEVKNHRQKSAEFFIISSRGTKLNRVTWDKAFRLRLKQIGLNRKGLSTYSLRHSLITSLINEDVSLFKIRELVGHKHITSTEPYVHIATKPLLLALQKHPIIRRQTDPATILKSLSELVETYRLREDKRFSYELKLTDKKLGLKVEIK